MKSLTRYAIAAALLICSAGFCERAQSQTKTPKKGSVAGKVTIKGKAAPGIVVGLRTSDYGSPYEPSYKATTDQDGKYRVNNVPTGSYQVAPVAPAFVVSGIQGARETVVLSEGESVEGIDFALVHGGAITGKVTDADGRPAIEQRVNLLGADPVPNQRGLVNVFSGVQTDDRGIYRMFGLAAGRYKIAAGQSNEGYFINNPGRPSFKLSFYTEASDAADASKAAVVEVTAGGESANIDITLGRAAQTFAASGRIVDENGQPIAGARLGMQHVVDEQRNSFVGANSSSNSKGEFRVENLPPGKYGIFLATQPDSDLRSDVVAFEIVDQDVNGLLVKSAKGAASLAGNIVLDNTDDKAVFAKLIQLRIQAFVQKSSAGLGLSPTMGHTATINADGSFRLGGLEPGSLYFTLGAQDRSLVKGFTISRVERDGVEPHNIEIKNGDQITGVRLVVSYGNATVLGVVKFEDGPLPAGARVFVRITKDGDTRPNMQSPQVDPRGHFIIQGITSGLYYFETSMFMPGVVGRPRPPVKQQVNVLDGVVTEVTITLDNPKPDSTPP